MSELQITPGVRLTARLTLFTAALRAGGVRAGVGELLAAHRALAAIDPASREEFYYALRAALCSRQEDLEVFDAVFDASFAVVGPNLQNDVIDETAQAILPRSPGEATPSARGGERSEERPQPVDLEDDPVPSAWSELEMLREKDFAKYTDRERAIARRLLARLAARGPRRRTRRTRAVQRRRGEVHDLRRTVRASLRYGGEPIERRWRDHVLGDRPLVMVVDVSGSMEPYARMLLQYVQACVAARKRVEAFAFGTRLTRITRELGGRDPDRALERAADAVVDWSGGTRIGDSLAELNRAHGRRIGRGSVVVILSDGWDRGDPELLAAEIARLRRTAYRLVWLNPLAAHPQYEPLTQGMQAALPSTDRLLAGNTIASLEELADLLEEGEIR